VAVGDGFYNFKELTEDEGLHGLWPKNIGGKTVADIGAASGGFLDQIRDLDAPPARVVAIEPADALRPDLRARGYSTFAYAEDAVEEFGGAVDLACTFNVIEHVPDPVKFLADIAALLTPTGRLLLSTPNRDDSLMDLAPTAYPAFFYRAAHRWYFDADALAGCAAQAGLKVAQVRYVQRYGLANALVWMRDGKPSQNDSLPGLRDPKLDQSWRDNLAHRGVADRLYAVLEKV
jgi:2-polyprenyl-3-methyl-5-hydroxy-6-metoxy-1,4-benzoquinol methylase